MSRTIPPAIILALPLALAAPQSLLQPRHCLGQEA
jgi:hypothetical protein